jgi:nucleoside-diphosphate-sugar epimerase
MPPLHAVFMDGVTGYLGRWTLFWLLEELPDERIAVLIRPRSRGSAAQDEVEQRLCDVLEAIGKQTDRERVSVIAGDLALPSLGNPAVLDDLRATVWMHVAGDVRFRPLGDTKVSTANRDQTASFVEAARAARHPPRAVCHTSTFYVHAKRGMASDVFQVPEEFLEPGEMEHDNAYGDSKLQAETYLAEQVRGGGLPFRVLVFRPDIVAHHIPVAEVSRHRPGLVVDDYKMIFQLLSALVGSPGRGSVGALKYLPADLHTRVYASDVDSIARAMAQLMVLSGDGGAGFGARDTYRVYNLVNRWQPLSVGMLRDACVSIGGAATHTVEVVPAERFRSQLLPGLPAAERLRYSALVEPFDAYLTRPTTEASTSNVDGVLGPAWHNLHPEHGRDVTPWFQAGVRAAFPSLYASEGVA